MKLLEKESALEAHLEYLAIDANLTYARSIVALFDLVYAALELDALLVVCGFDGRWEGRVLGAGERPVWVDLWDIVSPD